MPECTNKAQIVQWLKYFYNFDIYDYDDNDDDSPLGGGSSISNIIIIILFYYYLKLTLDYF